MNSISAIRMAALLAGLAGLGRAVSLGLAIYPDSGPIYYGRTLTLTTGIDIALTLCTGSVVFWANTNKIGEAPATPSVEYCNATLQTTTLPVGSWTLTASFQSATSPPVAVNILQATPKVSLTSSQNPSTFGQTVTLTATADPQYSGATAPTGTMFFTIGGKQHYSLGLVNGVATWTSAALMPTGAYVAVSYSGDTDYQGGNASLTQTVNQATPTIGLTPAPNPSAFGQAVTLTATVGPQFQGAAVPTGSVAFYDGTTQIASGTLSNGTASAQTSALTAGSHNLKATYGGDNNYQGASSNTVNQVVNQATTTSLATAPNPSTIGQTVILTATVSPTDGGGTVQFSDGGTNLGSPVPLSSNGTASFQTCALALGRHNLKATYSGDTSYQGSSGTASQVVNQQPATITSLASSPNPSTIGQPVTLTATVSPASGPTGTVVFYDGATQILSATLSNGTATATTSALALGTHSLKATYSGDTNFQGSASNVVSQVVNQVATTTSLQANPTSAKPGQSVALTATVSPATATGTVSFLDGSNPVGSVALSARTAIFATSTLAMGNHSLTASYGGDTNDAPSASQPVNVSVGLQTTTTTLAAAPNPGTVGQSVTLTATVSPGTVTGTVSFYDGANLLGTTAVSGGTATFNTSSLTAGNHSLTASYSGDSNNATSTSTAVVESMTGGTSTAAPNPVSVNPPSGNGSAQVMTFVFNDPNGWQSLDVVNILINNFLDGRDACYLAYSRTAGVLYLVKDDGGTLSAGLVLGGAGSVSNSQCSVASAASSASGSGNTLTVTLNLTFTSGFGGNKIVYLAARDGEGDNSGWQALGVWCLPFTPAGTIAVVSLTQARSAAAAGTAQTFVATLTDSQGAGDFGVANVLANNFIDGRYACYLAYVASTNSLLLVDDGGDAGGPFAGSMVLNGGAASIQNSQCAVNGAGSAAVKSGNTLTLILNITFKSPFAGNRIVWVAGRDGAGANNTDWQAMGTTTVQ